MKLIGNQERHRAMEGSIGHSADSGNRFDLSQVPFSRFGSYLSVKWLEGKGAPDRGEGYYLRIAHALHGRAGWLGYDSPVTGCVTIFDHRAD